MIEAPSKNSESKGVFVVRNDRGLHTRPCTELVKCATSFQSDLFLCYQKHRVNAKSILGILMLAATKGAKIKIHAEGSDSEEAVESIIRLAQNNFYIKY